MRTSNWSRGTLDLKCDMSHLGNFSFLFLLIIIITVSDVCNVNISRVGEFDKEQLMHRSDICNVDVFYLKSNQMYDLESLG